MSKSLKSRSLTLFYILVAYVFFQLIWWAIHIIQLTSQLGEGNEYTTRRIWMIIGEGLVFFILMSFGVYKIRKAFKQEVKLAQQKQNFALSISHELKSPIAAIKLFLQTLEKRELSEEKKIEILSKCISSANRLDSLVNNILLSNVVESKSYRVSPESINVKSLIEDVISVQKSTQSSAQINIEFNGDEVVAIDKDLLVSIGSNLIDNAVKYSEKPELINVKVSTNNNILVFQVSDQGQGISEGDKKLIFNRFFRSGDEITRKAKGTGLGLYIVKEMVQLLGGEISVNQNQPKGSVFKVTISLKNATNE